MRLIDVDALKESWKKNIENEGATLALLSALFKSVEDAPTIDAVEVVLCKDCRYAKDGYCINQNHKVMPTHYCSYGERKDNGRTDTEE